MGNSRTSGDQQDDETTTVIPHPSRNKVVTILSTSKDELKSHVLSKIKKKRKKIPLSRKLENERLRLKLGYLAGLSIQKN